MDIENFKKAYYEKLEGIGTDRIISIVNNLDERAKSEGKELVLLCFEDVRVDGEWCHRTIFSEWWEENVGEVIEELSDPTQPKVKGKSKGDSKKPAKDLAKEDSGCKQMSLFDCGMA